MIPNYAIDFALIVATLCIAALGCSQDTKHVPSAQNVSGPSELQRQKRSSSSVNATVPRPDGPSERDYPALHNLLQITEKIYSGSEPQSDEAFASLVRLNVRTIVSVDGSKPDVETARKHRLRYVHIPIGYDGVGQEAGLAIARLVAEADGPFYIHCHHGRHRGPAAAAVACIASGDVDGKAALKILEGAGTSRDYAGLWRDVENFRVPANSKLPELVEIAEVGSLAADMAKIDRAFDNLKLWRDTKRENPDHNSQLSPLHIAVVLKESLRESARNLGDDFGDEFKTWLAHAESQAQLLEDAFKSEQPDDVVDKQFQLLDNSCKQCHWKHRN